MKKILVLLLVFSAVFFYFGERYYNHKVEKTASDSVKAYEKNQQQELQKEKGQSALIEKNKFNSVLDWLKYKSNQKKEITISTFGSSVTAGTGASTKDKHWSGLLIKYLNEQEGISSVLLNNNGHGGYTTDRLISENKLNDVLTNKPDVVIIEPTIINNYGSSKSIEQTKNDVLYFVNEIKKNLPETLIIIQSSNPINTTKFNNKLGNVYTDYVSSLETLSKENKLNYFDVYSGIKSLMEKNNNELGNILADGVHPNDLGYEYWFETLKTAFESVPLINS